MSEQTSKAQECACPATCRVVGPVLMIVFGVIALARELSGKASRKQEVQNG